MKVLDRLLKNCREEEILIKSFFFAFLLCPSIRKLLSFTTLYPHILKNNLNFTKQ